MSNPYQAPSAPVTDPKPIVLKRPRVVTIALVILWLLLALWGSLAYASFPKSGELTDPWKIWYASYLLGTTIAPAWFFIKIAQGKNWARIAATILFALNFLWRMYLLFNFEEFSAQDITAIFIPFTLQLLGYLLLFLPRSTEWFKASSSS